MLRHSIILSGVVLMCFGPLLQAATVLVSTTADNGPGSLRHAIQHAASGDIIRFRIPKTEPGYVSATGIACIGLTSGELILDKNLTIDSAGQKIWLLRASGNIRIFNIMAGAVTISGLTLYNGAPLQNGGAILNTGSLSVNSCTFYGNSAVSGRMGGAIYSTGSLKISNCTFFGNASDSFGGAIANFGSLFLDHATISGNNSAEAAVANFGTAHVCNTIIVGNTSSRAEKDVRGNFISDGFNAIGRTWNSTGFGRSGDHLAVTPAQVKLGRLQDNGGPTPTMRPGRGSIAVDQGKAEVDSNTKALKADQCGRARLVDFPEIPNAVGGDGTDIGAVESGPNA
ncbi:MAG TPA: choice-of-anchor Q domain-containing protein [Candidatus Udaeobacter sp.]|jgi:predicted outer membrane repeat protein|nr:choice-of-anchor Q domain-containing protein [Candidatus Udaeobacter sp.]